jgi:hypothetical protein
MTVQLDATVRNPDGSSISGSALSWNWSFGDGTGSATEATPQHSFAPGVYPVTVQVTDDSTGRGGTAAVPVAFSPSAGPGPGNRSGAGSSSKSRTPSGPQNSRGNHPGGARGKANANSAPSGGTHSSSTSAARPTKPASTTAGHTAASSGSTPRASSQPPTGATPHTAGHAKATAPAKKPAKAVPRPPANAPHVTGRLISDVTPLPPGASPLVRSVPAALATAPAARGAVRTSILAPLGAAFAVVLLFGLGALRELHGRFDRKALLRFRD